MEENRLVVELWGAVSGQWVYTPAGYRSALRTSALDLPMRLLADQYPRLDRLRLLADIQALAAAIAGVHNRRLEKRQNRMTDHAQT